MTRTIDCRNLECPKPVIMTKNALEGLNEGESLEIIVNALAPKENISRFLKNQNIDYEEFENYFDNLKSKGFNTNEKTNKIMEFIKQKSKREEE